MTLNIFPIPALKDNYIWCLVENHQAWVVDPGESKPVITFCQQKNIILKGILITHHHWDHTKGVLDLIEFFGPLTIIASQISKVPSVNHFVRENDEVDCLSTSLKILEIPGHTLDHIAYFNQNILFCGDTLFSIGCGKIFEGNAEQMYTSLQKLKNSPPQTKLYCGHEYTLANLQFAKQVDPDNPAIDIKINQTKLLLSNQHSTLPNILSEEKLLNPFLRCEERIIKESVENHIGKKLNNPVEVFAHLREWKNQTK